MKKKSIAFLASVILIIALSFAAFHSLSLADGGSKRPATKAEKEVYKKVLTTLANSLSAGPDGWEFTGQTQIQELEYVSASAANYPMTFFYDINWQDTQRINETSVEANKQLTVFLNQPPDPQIEELTQKNTELAEQLGKAIEKKDTKEIEHIIKESDALNAKIQPLYAKRDNAYKELQVKLTPFDVRVNISIDVNCFGIGLGDKPIKGTSIAGFQTIKLPREFNFQYGIWQEDTTYVFVGSNWRFIKNGGYEMKATPIKGAAHTAVQNMIIRIEADNSRVPQVIDKINWDALKKLLKK